MGLCMRDQPQGPTDLGCKTWDWDNQVCLECSARWVQIDGACRAVSDQCREHDAAGLCVSCYKGYSVVDGECVADEPIMPEDLGCKTWDWDNMICLECSARWVQVDGVCLPVSDHCREHDAAGACTSCYKGFSVIDGECVADEPQGPTDLGCKTWDWDNQVCLECSARWVQIDGVCVAISDNCREHDANAECTACYKGYSVVDGECVADEPQGPTDLGCKTWDWDNQVCLECSERWVQIDGVCVAVSDHCREHDAAGLCVACYKGYSVVDGECVADEPIMPVDLGCKTWDWDNQICLECSERWVSQDGVCVPVNDHC